MTGQRTPGRFITFEGGEGAGKSTQIRRLASALRESGHDVVETREPGGSPGAEAVRHVLLSGAAEEFGVRMEALLFTAARNDHVEQLIRPAVRAGRIVLCDRFMDSTRVYQGVTGNLEPAFVQALERLAIDGMTPDLTLLLDLPVEVGLERIRKRSGKGAEGYEPDRFEKDDVKTHASRRDAYLELAAREAERIRVISADRSEDEVFADVLAAATGVLGQTSAPRAKRRAGRRTR